jgi:hypothetical protein
MTIILIEKEVKQPMNKLKCFMFDLHNYESWWNNYNTKFDRQNQLIKFKPIAFKTLGLKYRKILDNQIEFDYVFAPFKGSGTWNLKEVSTFETNVTYTISITSNNIIIRAFINSKIFKWKHNRDVLNLINKLNTI